MTAAEERLETAGRTWQPLFEPGDAVAVLGLGRSGLAAARLAHRLEGRVYASDVASGRAQREACDTLRAEGIDAEMGRHDAEKILACRVVVASPGIDPASEIRRLLREKGRPVVAEVELAFRHLQSRIVGITGTNGKTTTTALCGHLLQQGGFSAVTAGNIGRPLSDVAREDRQPDWVVVELSSFQLADIQLFSPAIGVLLNLGPDHLDRYSSLHRYYEDKRRLFDNATPESCWLLNADDAGVVELARGVPGRHFFASTRGSVLPGAFLDGGWVCLDIPGRRERWIPVTDLRLVGRHNVTNALLAGLAAALVGCPAESIAEGLRTFEGLPHRLQPVAAAGGVTWVNDSKATNLSATLVALRAFESPVVLCLGGRHKGESYAGLAATADRIRGVVAFGEAAPLIVSALGDSVPVQLAGGMESVVRTAGDLAEPGDVVLFSPACSSYDMFPDYEARGRAFTEAVRRLLGPHARAAEVGASDGGEGGGR